MLYPCNKFIGILNSKAKHEIWLIEDNCGSCSFFFLSLDDLRSHAFSNMTNIRKKHAFVEDKVNSTRCRQWGVGTAN